MNFKRSLAAMALAAVSLLSAKNASAQQIISNATTVVDGNVSLGVRPFGNLNVCADISTIQLNPKYCNQGTGVQSNTTGNDGTAKGCQCEGWGAGVWGGTYDGTWGGANEDEFVSGQFNLSDVNFTTNTVDQATSVVTIRDGSGNPVMQVTHAFLPTTSPYLYKVSVSIKNLTNGVLGNTPNGIRYTRLMDWDIEPTAFHEVVSLVGNGNSSNLITTSDDAFWFDGNSVNPFASRVVESYTCSPYSTVALGADFSNQGQCDHGALFDFGFAPLQANGDPNDSRNFTIYYGVAPSRTSMLSAMVEVGAENVYSFGQSQDCFDGRNPDGSMIPTSNPCETFAFAFGGVGADVIVDPNLAPEPASLVLMATGLIGIGGVVRRRRKTA